MGPPQEYGGYLQGHMSGSTRVTSGLYAASCWVLRRAYKQASLPVRCRTYKQVVLSVLARAYMRAQRLDLELEHIMGLRLLQHLHVGLWVLIKGSKPEEVSKTNVDHGAEGPTNGQNLAAGKRR